MFGKIKNSNKGMAMVTTIIMVALIAVLSGSLMQMAYLSYSRKVVERRSNETFYTAESCIDTIKTSVQNSVASSIPVAKEGQLEFAKSAYAVLAGVTSNTVTGSSTVLITKSHPLYTYLYNKLVYNDDGSLKTDADIYHGYNFTAGETATAIKDAIDPAKYGGDFTIGEMKVEATGVRIKDVYIKVVNKQGYVAEIKTDIVINAPIYAEDIEVPTGSYSMFAGNGSTFHATDNYAYIHQEGNVYVGYYQAPDGTKSDTALEVKSNKDMYGNISFGGTNIIFNGDVYVDNGNSITFTGGNGKEGCNIQVNGYIYLKNAAAILLPPNANLVCRGIMEWDSTLSQYVPYTGNGNNNTSLDQFYPMTETYMDGKDGYSNYISDSDGVEYNVFDLLKKHGKEIAADCWIHNPTWWDPRVKSLLQNHDKGVGVYILDAEYDSDKGFYNRKNDKYYLLKGSYNASTKTMTWTPADSTASGVYDGQISCRPADTKLNIKEKISYNGKAYDSEFAKIINVQVLDLYKNYGNNFLLEYQYEGFDPTNAATYKEYTWKGGIPTGTKDAAGNNIVTSLKEILKMVPGAEKEIVDKIMWGQMKQSTDPEDEKEDNDPLLGDRIFRAPNNVNTASSKLINSIDTDLYFTTDIYAPNSSTPYSYKALSNGCRVGNVGHSTTINNSDVGFYFLVTTDKLDVKVPDYYTGIFMSSDRVEFTGCNGYSSGVSILEAGKHATATGYTNKEGLKDANNPVRQILIKLSSCMLGGNSARWESNGVSQNSNIAGLNMVDGLFAGGIQSMWKTGDTISGGGGGNNQNAGNFVDNDNWSKNPTP